MRLEAPWLWLARSQFLVLISAATLMSVMPIQSTPVEQLWDKGVHFFGWGGLYLSLQLALRFRGGLMATVLGLLACSFLIECAQGMLAWRTFDWLDVLANGLGILTAALALRLVTAVARLR